ncbi:hypothetical protein AB0392_46475 [Nonomuraea angiospora]|uniref:hypothetical protein n=1 Tax=Nonomuraea angiospora TaxID=46172 RepID=UPI00344F402E
MGAGAATTTNLEAQHDAERHTAPLDDRLRFDLTAFFEAGLRLLLDGVAVQLGRQHRP